MELGWGGDIMTFFEQMEQLGQTNIFEFLPISYDGKRNKGFMEGDPVKIRFYQDEYDFITNQHPQLLETGEIIDRHLEFYRVRIGDTIIDVPGEKLILI